MLRFFSKIRYQLAAENRVSKYLRYAIGEIFLVVIGILIAIQINNFNDSLKTSSKEINLKDKLFEELLKVREYNNDVFKEEINTHLGYLELILKEGSKLDIDSFINSAEDYWAVKNFSLITYIFNFASFYDPNFNLYKTSTNDGSIFLIEDKNFASDLDFIYIGATQKMERLYEKEINLNLDMLMYISEKYGHLFSGNFDSSNGNRDSISTRHLFSEVVNDGTLRFLLQRKVHIIKSKKGIIVSQINPIVEKFIERYQKE